MPDECKHSIMIEGLTVRAGEEILLDNVSASINCGETTAIIGPNGAGKTTLLSALLGLIPYEGKINFCHTREHGGGAPVIGYVPQRLDFDRGMPLTVMDYLCLSHQKKPLWLGAVKEVRERCVMHLKKVAADHLVERRLGKLSGGELQRVMLALTLMSDPDILLLDEPVSGIDMAGGELFCDMIEELHRKKRFTLVLVSHDLSVVTSHAEQVICLNKSIQCQGRALEVLTEETISRVYGLHVGLYQHESCSHHGEGT